MKIYVVYQKDAEGEFTGVVCAYTDIDRANANLDQLSAADKDEGYTYVIEDCDLDPPDDEH